MNNIDSDLRRESISSQISSRLRRSIFTGEYAPGDKLPTERELASSFGVSLVTVRQALKELEGEEWIKITQGRGVTALDYSRKIGLDVLPSLMETSPKTVVTPDSFLVMNDFSDWLLMKICVSAAERADKSCEEKLLNIIRRYEDGISVEEYFVIDTDLIYAYLEIADNLILKMFYNTYVKIYYRLVSSGTFPLPVLPRELFIRINSEMVRAICGGKKDRIPALIKKHKPEVNAALGQYLEMLGGDVGGQGD